MLKVLIGFALLLAAGVVEWQLHRRRLNQVAVRVLVNGTRGKTSVTRMLAGALRAAGLTVYAKSTGSEATVILPDGSEEQLVRRRGPRLTEQIAFFRRAAKAGAQAAVVECMAVLPESQRVMATKLVRPTLVLITNARVDHIAEMGATEADTVRSLSFSIPKGARVIAADSRFAAYAPVEAPDPALPEGALTGFDYPVYAENVALVLAAAKALGVDSDTALRGMRAAAPDVGMAGPFQKGETLIINAFAANDLISTRQVYRQARAEHGDLPVRVLYNNRSDREYRLREFVPLMKEMKSAGACLSVIGDHPGKVLKYYQRRAGIAAGPKQVEEVLKGRSLVLLMGNIKGAGRQLIEGLRAEART